MSREDHDHLTTADLVAGTDAREAERPEIPVQAGVQPQPGMRNPGMGERRMDEPRMPDPGMQRGQPAAAGQPRGEHGVGDHGMDHGMEQLAALFPPEVASGFRSRWDQVQISFVDDPRQAVQQADELVAQVMKSLASNFAEQRSRLEAGIGHGGEVNTENLRMALRSYRSFFQRLLSL